MKVNFAVIRVAKTQLFRDWLSQDRLVAKVAWLVKAEMIMEIAPNALLELFSRMIFQETRIKRLTKLKIVGLNKIFYQL
jgi:hypothetical protein